MRTAGVYGTVLLAMSMASAFAQTKDTTATSHQTATAQSDTRFIADAAQGTLAEVKLGELAQEKSKTSPPALGTFSKRMLDDDTKTSTSLKPIASKQHVAWPITLDAENTRTYDRLSKLSGPAFDRAYMQAIVKNQRAEVSAFNTEARMGTMQDVKAFASKTLPTLEDQLKMAEATTGAVAPAGTAKLQARGTTAAK